ncbi:MAG: Uma2 family endonuclease [Pyrinomonadaceae bacterium]|nr:Uma2 family endonuclease [Pyrinomonadaceae bacterium]
MSAPVLPLLTVSDLDVLPEDGKTYELIGGGLYVSRAPHIHHQLVVSNITGSFFAYLSKSQIGKVAPGPGVIFTEYDAVIPDIVFLTNERYKQIVSPEGKLTAAPDLAIEILSLGADNLRRDRVVKLRLYGEHGVKEYWIVDLFTLSVEIYRLQENGLALVETLKIDDHITSPMLPDFELKVSDIFQF